MFGLDTTETIFSLAIAIIYPFFFSKLTTKLTKYDEVNEMCDHYDSSIRYGYGYMYPGFNKGNKEESESAEQIAKKEEFEKCEKEKKVRLDQVNFNRHIMLIVIAFLGIIGSSAIQTQSTKLGVGLGGVLTLILALFLYWHKYGENSKLIILGLSFALLMYLSVKLYKMESAADLFSLIEFGSKK